jgi:hypothetical protein
MDPVAKLRGDAVQALSNQDDNLDIAQKLKILQLFREDYTAVQTYVALLDNEPLRKEWLRAQL